MRSGFPPATILAPRTTLTLSQQPLGVQEYMYLLLLVSLTHQLLPSPTLALQISQASDLTAAAQSWQRWFDRVLPFEPETLFGDKIQSHQPRKLILYVFSCNMESHELVDTLYHLQSQGGPSFIQLYPFSLVYHLSLQLESPTVAPGTAIVLVNECQFGTAGVNVTWVLLHRSLLPSPRMWTPQGQEFLWVSFTG